MENINIDEMKVCKVRVIDFYNSFKKLEQDFNIDFDKYFEQRALRSEVVLNKLTQ